MAPTRNTSHPPEKDLAHIPRPPNCFILYRANKLTQLRREAREVPGCSPKDKRALISRMWQEEPEEVVEYWRQVAEQKAAEHREAYPNYKYQPKKKKRPTAALQNQRYETPGSSVVQMSDIPLLPVPALVPSYRAEDDEGCEVGTASSPSDLSSQSVQACTIISPSFIRPSPNFSFLTLEEPSALTTAYDAPSQTHDISLPTVLSIQSQSSTMRSPVLERSTELRARQPYQPRFASFSSDMDFAQPPHYTVPSAGSRYPQVYASTMQDDTHMELGTPPIVPSHGDTSWVLGNATYGVEHAGHSAEEPATSVSAPTSRDNCLLDMVSSLLFLPENMLSSFYF